MTAALSFSARHEFAGGFTLDASFEIDSPIDPDAAGSITALYGPSGSGKTTILSMIAGLMRPNAGSIRLGDRMVFDARDRTYVPPESRGVGLVFQDVLLFPHLSVMGNLAYGRRRTTRRRISFDRVVELLHLAPLLHRNTRSLSGGERQRVGLARAMLREPDVLLLDEPVAALDEALRRDVLDDLARMIAEWSIPTIFVSHDQADVRRLTREVVVLERGRVIAAGPTASTLDRLFAAGSPAVSRPTNVLSLEPMSRNAGAPAWSLAGHQFHAAHIVPADSRGGAGARLARIRPVIVEISPTDVILSKSRIDGISVRNQLPGALREIVARDADSVHASIELGDGVLLWAELTPAAVTDLALAPGSPIVCLIKATAVRVMGAR
jgi:molybdate transport system ATP-binding protein